MISRLLSLPALSMLLAISLFSIMLIGGCPAAQTPTVPSQQDDDDQATQPPPTTPDDGLDRPISQPELDDTRTSDGGRSVPSGPSGGDGDTAMVILTVEDPSDPLAVRPGTVVSVRFNLLDRAGAVERGELLVARDNDNDGQPDGNAVLTRLIGDVSEGVNTVAFNTSEAAGLLTNGFGRFLLGVRTTTISDETKTAYSPGTLTIDAVAPSATWVGAGSPPAIPVDREDHLVNRDLSWTVELNTSDNSPHTVRIWLENVENGTRFELVPETTYAAGAATRSSTMSLAAYPANTYFYYVEVSDGIEPALTFYGENQAAAAIRLAVTNRLIGTFELEQLADAPPNPAQSKGAIVEGVNLNDLAGSSMVSVPDLDDDGDSELIIGARFGKPNLPSGFAGRGWGEAYLIYGNGAMRLSGKSALNSVGGSISGLTFRGMRVPLCQSNYTEGLSDITVIDDMDGDDLPELVFSFPRVESLNLGAPAWVGSNAFQHPELLVDQATALAGSLEYDAIDYMGGSWITDRAQFTRGGIVIVSSHNELLTDPGQVTRKFDRVLDLHEIGQLFTWMMRPSVWPYILALYLDPEEPFGCADCIPQLPEGCECEDTSEEIPDCEIGCGSCFDFDNIPEETEFFSWITIWDVWLGGG